jgi:AcrR family transcriptional regulator
MPRRPARSPSLSDIDDRYAGAAIWESVEGETARRLLVSALLEFSDNGFKAATTRAIGQRAGLSSAGVYVYFQAKTDLLYELCRVGHGSVLDAVLDAVQQAPSDAPLKRIEAYVHAFTLWHAENHVLARVIQYELRALPPAQMRSIAQLRARFEAIMAELLESGREQQALSVPDVMGTTRAILSLGIDLARWYDPPDPEDPNRIADLYAGLVRSMLAPQTSPARG